MAVRRDKNFKTKFAEIPKRVGYSKSSATGILDYDLDNKYPQRMKLLADSSVTATSCLSLYVKHIKGDGFRDELVGATVVNLSDMSLDEILDNICNDLAYYGGFALHFNYNGLFEITTINVVPFDYCRLTNDEAKNENQGKIAVYHDWGQVISSKSIKPDFIKYVDRFTTDQDKILSQISAAGGIEKWNGHILYYSRIPGKYPLPIYDCAANDIETDAELSQFRKSNTLTSFLANYMVLLQQKFEDDADEDAYMENLNKFQGGRNAGKMMLISGVNDSNKPTFEKIDVASNDRIFEYTEESSRENIRMAFLAPKELIGMEHSSGFDSNRITQARQYYNSITAFERDEISKQFKRFMPLYKASPESDNFEIKPLFEGELQTESNPQPEKIQ